MAVMEPGCWTPGFLFGLSLSPWTSNSFSPPSPAKPATNRTAASSRPPCMACRSRASFRCGRARAMCRRPNSSQGPPSKACWRARPSTPGSAAFRNCARRWPAITARHFGRGFSHENFFVTSGGMQAIQTVMQMVAGDGDEIIIPTPAWPNYAGPLRIHGSRSRRSADGLSQRPLDARSRPPLRCHHAAHQGDLRSTRRPTRSAGRRRWRN